MTPIVRRLAAGLLATAAVAGVTLVGVPAAAQKPAAKPAAEKPVKLSKPVLALVTEAQKLLAANDNAGALAKINEALALPNQTADDTYTLLRFRLNAAIGLNDNPTVEDTLAKLLLTGRVSAEDQPKYYRNIGAFAMQRKDYATATAAFEKLIALDPNNAENKVALGELYFSQKQNAKAVETISAAIATQTAAGQKAPENWYRRALGISYDGKLGPLVQSSALALVAAYPNPVNWRDAIVILRDSFQRMDDSTELDFLRLQAATGSLNGERDYIEYADTALRGGFPGEAQFAINEGVSRKMLDAGKPLVVEMKKSADGKVAADKASLPGLEKEAKGNPKLIVATGDAWYGYGDYAKAAALYRQAQGNAAIDQSIVNLRLGAALARGGDAAGAAAALGQVTAAGPRAALAQYWLAHVKAPKA
ncbi:hypothetical protein IP88_10335 [alpha proteobacterium AAP81b]|nr:hypothetical protein IP88_10335 [alpha proteobacterium AAP81b]